MDKNIEKIAIYAGSFDPITKGHKSMITKASKIFDKVIVGVLNNSKKTPLFSMEERVSLIQKCTLELPNVEVKMSQGMLVDFAKENDANFVIRGLRNIADFESEFLISRVNKQLYPDLETVLLFPEVQFQNLSSSLAKEIASFGKDVSWIIPAEILDKFILKFK